MPVCKRVPAIGPKRVLSRYLLPVVACATIAPLTSTAFAQAAGTPAPGDIRTRVEQESALERPSRTLVERLMFWRTPAAQPGLAIDPAREAQRLRENAALGQAPTEGDSRIIQPRTRSLFDRLF